MRVRPKYREPQIRILLPVERAAYRAKIIEADLRPVPSGAVSGV